MLNLTCKCVGLLLPIWMSKSIPLLSKHTGVGDSDGNYLFRKDIGWLCAQRRVGRALGWLSHQYSSDAALPDVLLLVDDDTFVVRRYLSVLVVLAWLSLDLVIG